METAWQTGLTWSVTGASTESLLVWVPGREWSGRAKGRTLVSLCSSFHHGAAWFSSIRGNSCGGWWQIRYLGRGWLEYKYGRKALEGCTGTGRYLSCATCSSEAAASDILYGLVPFSPSENPRSCMKYINADSILLNHNRYFWKTTLELRWKKMR